MKKSAYWNHRLHHFERDCSYTGDGIWDSKLSWKMDDIWYERCMMLSNRAKFM